MVSRGSVDFVSFFFGRSGFPATVTAHPRCRVFADNIFYELLIVIGPIQNIVISTIGFFKLNLWSILNAIGPLVSRIAK